MKFTGDLGPAASLVAQAVNKKSTMDVTRSTQIVVRDGEARLSGTDFATSIECTVPVEDAKNGVVHVDAQALRDVTKAVGRATFTLDGTRLQIVGGKTKVRLTLMTQDDLPEIEIPDMTEVATQELLPALSHAMTSAAVDETRMNLCGVHLSSADGFLTIQGTDGHRLYKTTIKSTLAPRDPVIVDRKGLASLRRIAEGFESVSVGFSRTHAVFSVPGCVLSTRLIDMAYPDTRQVIPAPKTRTIRASLSAVELAGAIRTVTAIGKADAVKVSVGSAVTVSCDNPDNGRAESTIGTIDVTGSVELAVNHRYLVDAIGQIGDGQILVEAVDPLSPVCLSGEGDRIAIVMPMRL